MVENLKEKYNPEGSLLRKHQLRILDILKEVDAICRKNNIDYWLAAGTALGAVRHQGFIPWDDDIDIEVPRTDYLKLIKLLENELPSNMIVQTNETDHLWFQNYAKVRDVNSFMKGKYEKNMRYKYQGVFIDIFPVESETLICHALGHCLQAFFMRSNMCYYKQWDRFTVRCFKMLKLLYVLFRAFDKLFASKNYFDVTYGIRFSNRHAKKYIYPLKDILFEGHYFLAPANPDMYLKELFKDYMKIPEENKRKFHASSVRFSD
jgi:lipopolysaccharide cholinephosphotransferase